MREGRQKNPSSSADIVQVQEVLLAEVDLRPGEALRFLQRLPHDLGRGHDSGRIRFWQETPTAKRQEGQSSNTVFDAS